MSKGRILFMGTPEFAVVSLNALVAAGFEVVAVVTAPDKPAGRGRRPRASAVKERAMALGLPVLQPLLLKDPAFLAELDRLAATLYVVVAFRMLPRAVWDKPAMGTINLHASLLPDYRGAAPINWAVINGESITGATTFKIAEAIDTGDILLRQELGIGPEDNAGDVHDRLMMLGAGLLVRTVEGLFAGTLTAIPQGQGASHVAPKLTPANCRIAWSEPTGRVHDLVRGLAPHPGAWTTWITPGAAPQRFKVLRTRPSDRSGDAEAGAVTINGDLLFVRTKTGWLEILELQPEGARRMDAASYIRGLRTTAGHRFE